MYIHNKRHSSGSLIPNVFFMLQLIAIALLSYMFSEIAPIFNISSMIMYGMVIVVIGVIYSCLEKRYTIIKRQRYC